VCIIFVWSQGTLKLSLTPNHRRLSARPNSSPAPMIDDRKKKDRLQSFIYNNIEMKKGIYNLMFVYKKEKV
jgi:hypothetical protein